MSLARSFQEFFEVTPTEMGLYTWHRGYFIRFYEEANNVYTIRIPLATLSEEQVKLVSDRLAWLKAEKLVKKNNLVGNQIEWQIVPRGFGLKKGHAQTAALLEQETLWLAENHLKPGCAQCGLEGTHEVLALNEQHLPFCSSCQSEYQTSLRANLTSDETGRNYLTGLIGAVLGAGFGAGLFFLVAHFTDRFFGVLAVIIGILAGALYRRFKGKLTVTGGILMGLVTLAVAVVAFFIYMYLILSSYYYDLTPGIFVRDLDIVMGMDGVMSDFLFYLLFVVISLVMTIVGFLKEIKLRQQTMTELGIQSGKKDVM